MLVGVWIFFVRFVSSWFETEREQYEIAEINPQLAKALSLRRPSVRSCRRIGAQGESPGVTWSVR